MGYYQPRAPFLFEEVVAYHGTSIDAARSIVDAQHMRVSDRPDEWLGRGAYFFQGSIHRARQWAKQYHKGKAAVVSARFRLGHCIDLTDNRWIPPLRVIEEDLQREGGEHAPRNKGKRHILDCMAVNRLAEMWRPDTISATYPEALGGPIDPGNSFQDATHVQLAVRDPDKTILELRYDDGAL